MFQQNDDFELKKLVWSSLVGLCENDAIRQVRANLELGTLVNSLND